MKLLLDTHTFIWLDDNPVRVSGAALSACHDSRNTLHLSLGSVWELQIKSQLGKIRLLKPLPDLLRTNEEQNGLRLEPVLLADIFMLEKLPPIHRDPFDRILIAQAIRGDFRFVSCDPEIAKYDVQVLW